MATNQDPQNPLQCPRCSSSNTKFCYYNNYSLSQPRHFCKACKRYWTRGGTLRNVPVGGGCRNKRHNRRPSHGGDGISISSSASANPNRIDLSPSPNNFQNPMLYGLANNHQEINSPFSSFRVSSDSAGFDLHRQIGLGFSSSNSSPIFFGSSSFSTSSTVASLLASTLQQQKEITQTRVHDRIPNLMPYEDPQVKVGEENKFSWNPNPNPVDQINSSYPSSLLWNTSGWFDPSTMGSSLSSLL